MKFYGIKNCSSVKKAMEFLEAKNIEFDFLDIKKIDEKTLDFWLEKRDIKELVNTSSMTARKLKIDKNFVLSSSKDELKTLFLSNLSIIKRPVIYVDDKLLLAKEYEQYFS